MLRPRGEPKLLEPLHTQPCLRTFNPLVAPPFLMSRASKNSRWLVMARLWALKVSASISSDQGGDVGKHRMQADAHAADVLYLPAFEERDL